MPKLTDSEAKDKLMKCSRMAINDISESRIKAKQPVWGDPAIKQLESVLDGNYKGDGSINDISCYIVGNLKGWSASRLIKDKTSPEFEKKTEQIKGCKAIIKAFCDHIYTE